MWVAKFAIIAYLFNISLLFVGYMIEQGLGITLFTKADDSPLLTDDYLANVTNANDIDITPNPSSIFGDFITSATSIGGLIIGSLTGGFIGDMLGQIPFVSWPVIALVRVLITFSGAMLAYQLLTGRGT